MPLSVAARGALHAAGAGLCALAGLLGGQAVGAEEFRWSDLPLAYSGAPGPIVPAAQPRTGKPQAKNGHDHYSVDSEHIFGFTLGTDIGEKGELELELEPVAAIGKRFGTYFATSQLAQVKYTITDSFRIAPGVSFATHKISDVPSLDDRSQAAVAGASSEIRYRLFDRQKGPFGLTFNVAPGWNRVDELSGARVEQYGADLGVLLDKELIAGRLYGAINFNYDLAATRLRDTGEWSHDSAVGINVALTNQVLSGILIGAEARYFHAYEGLGLDRFKGEALYVGPTFLFKLGKHAALSGAWNVQVAGKAADEPGALDLVNFERHQVLLRFNALLNPE